MIHARDAKERLTYMLFGRLGQLIPELEDPNSDGAVISAYVKHDLSLDNPIVNVYDNFAHAWVDIPFNQMKWTYSFVPRPINPVFEVDYFVRACGLIKHQFIWSTPSIPYEIFTRVFHPYNRENLGRYTIMPWLPSVKDVIRYERGYRQFADNTFMFGTPAQAAPAAPAQAAPAAPAQNPQNDE